LGTVHSHPNGSPFPSETDIHSFGGNQNNLLMGVYTGEFLNLYTHVRYDGVGVHEANPTGLIANGDTNITPLHTNTRSVPRGATEHEDPVERIEVSGGEIQVHVKPNPDIVRTVVASANSAPINTEQVPRTDEVVHLPLCWSDNEWADFERGYIPDRSLNITLLNPVRNNLDRVSMDVDSRTGGEPCGNK